MTIYYVNMYPMPMQSRAILKEGKTKITFTGPVALLVDGAPWGWDKEFGPEGFEVGPPWLWWGPG